MSPFFQFQQNWCKLLDQVAGHDDSTNLPLLRREGTTVRQSLLGSILACMPVILRRLQRRHATFLSDALAAVHRVASIFFAVTPLSGVGPPPSDTEYVPGSQLLRNLQAVQQNTSMSAERSYGSSGIASGLKGLLHGSPSALDSWPPAQAQQGRAALSRFALELAAKTAPWPTLTDAPVLASLPPQKRRALLDESARLSGSHPSQRSCSGLLAACMTALRKLRSGAPQTGGAATRGAGEGSDSSNGGVTQSLGPGPSGSSAALLGEAVMLHGAVTSRWCGDACSHWPTCDAAADPFHRVPACVAALLDAAGQVQVAVNLHSQCA